MSGSLSVRWDGLRKERGHPHLLYNPQTKQIALDDMKRVLDLECYVLGLVRHGDWLYYSENYAKLTRMKKEEGVSKGFFIKKKKLIRVFGGFLSSRG